MGQNGVSKYPNLTLLPKKRFLGHPVELNFKITSHLVLFQNQNHKEGKQKIIHAKHMEKRECS